MSQQEIRTFWQETDFKSAKGFIYNLQNSGPNPILKDQVLHHSIRGEGVVFSESAIKRFRQTILTEIEPVAVAACHIPRHGIVFYDADSNPVAHISICFQCNNLTYGPGEFTSKVDLQPFREEILAAGLPIFRDEKEYESYLRPPKEAPHTTDAIAALAFAQDFFDKIGPSMQLGPVYEMFFDPNPRSYPDDWYFDFSIRRKDGKTMGPTESFAGAPGFIISKVDGSGEVVGFHWLSEQQRKVNILSKVDRLLQNYATNSGFYAYLRKNIGIEIKEILAWKKHIKQHDLTPDEEAEYLRAVIFQFLDVHNFDH